MKRKHTLMLEHIINKNVLSSEFSTFIITIWVNKILINLTKSEVANSITFKRGHPPNVEIDD